MKNGTTYRIGGSLRTAPSHGQADRRSLEILVFQPQRKPGDPTGEALFPGPQSCGGPEMNRPEPRSLDSHSEARKNPIQVV